MKFNEDSRVKIPSILHLTRLGYKNISLKDEPFAKEAIKVIHTNYKKNNN